MATSQNGFLANNRALVASQRIPGTQVNISVRTDAPGLLLLEVAAAFDRLVEDVDNARGALDDWGYAERPIRGGGQLSNHASGTAIDLNATRHPLGTSPSANFSAAQVVQIRRIVAVTGGVVRWGGDYTGRKDPMHFEINDGRTVAQCRVALDAMRRFNGSPSPQEVDVPFPTLKLGDGVPDRLDTGPADPGRQHWFVDSVQTLLNRRGLKDDTGKPLPPLLVDGQFGTATEARVKVLQRRSGVPQTGRVDAVTWYWLAGNDAPDFA
jgi:peptidoglycan hydrolase-like protein with peptidoglycan-binding domain